MADVEIVTQLTGLQAVQQGFKQIQADLNGLGTVTKSVGESFAKVC